MLTLVTRHDCHLCAEMERVARAVAAELGIELETRDVDADPQLHDQYDDSVPVLLIDGRRAFKYRVTHQELRRRLEPPGERKRQSLWQRVIGGRKAGGDESSQT